MCVKSFHTHTRPHTSVRPPLFVPLCAIDWFSMFIGNYVYTEFELSWIEQKAVIFKQMVVGFGNFIFSWTLFLVHVSVCVWWRKSTLNLWDLILQTTQHNGWNWLLLPIMYLLCLAWSRSLRFHSHIPHTQQQKMRTLYKYNQFRRWFLPFVLIRFIIFAIGK